MALSLGRYLCFQGAVRTAILSPLRQSSFISLPNPGGVQVRRIFEGNLHFKDPAPRVTAPDLSKESKEVPEFHLEHPIWSSEEVSSVRITHLDPNGTVDRLAYGAVWFLRRSFDLFSGYKRGPMTADKWLNRIIFLETIAGVPGFVGGMVRHLNSLRRMKRDHGWIHTLLEEAENERMHLMTAMALKNPGFFFRWAVLFSQGVFVNFFFVAYLWSPRFCHRFVGYLEEEAVKTYTGLLEAIEQDQVPEWKMMKAPEISIKYWKLPQEALWKDVILAIRADEAHHRNVNHTFGCMKTEQPNPYGPGR